MPLMDLGYNWQTVAVVPRKAGETIPTFALSRNHNIPYRLAKVDEKVAVFVRAERLAEVKPAPASDLPHWLHGDDGRRLAVGLGVANGGDLPPTVTVDGETLTLTEGDDWGGGVFHAYYH